MKKFLGNYKEGAPKIRTFPKDLKVHPGIEDGTFGCKPLELKPVRGCGRVPSGLRNSLTLPVYPGSPEELLEMISLTGLTVDSLFLVPDGDVYHAKPARQILEEEKGQTKDLVNSVLKRK